MKSFFVVFRTELIKTKNSYAVKLVILGAAFIPFFFFLNHLHQWKGYLPAAGENPWNDYFRKGFNGVHFTFFPMLIVLIAALLLNIEHKSNTWKHIFVLPASKSNIFLSKYLIMIGLVVMYYFLFMVFMFAGAAVLNVWKPEFRFFDYFPSYRYGSVQSGLGDFVVKSFISILTVAAIHFWLSFRTKNLFLNIGIGLAGIVTAVSMFVAHWDSMVYFPYGFPVLMCNFIPDHRRYLSDFHLMSLLYFSLVTLLSYIDFTRRFKG